MESCEKWTASEISTTLLNYEAMSTVRVTTQHMR